MADRTKTALLAALVLGVWANVASTWQVSTTVRSLQATLHDIDGTLTNIEANTSDAQDDDEDEAANEHAVSWRSVPAAGTVHALHHRRLETR